MGRYIFNLNIEPNYLPQPISEERTGKYNETIELLTALDIIGQFKVREDGPMERGFIDGSTMRRAYFDIFDRERMLATDFTNPEDRERIMKTTPPQYLGIVSNFMRLLLIRGIGNSEKMIGKITEETVITPLGRQSLHIHYMGGGIDRIEERRYGLGRKGMFLREVSTDFELYRNLRV